MQEYKYFRLFSSCKVVRGINMGAVYLLNRERVERIPLEVCDLIDELSNNSISSVKALYEESDFIDEWIDYLWRHNIGHYTNNPESFPDSEEEYCKPSLIRRIQLAYSKESCYNLMKVTEGLDRLFCKHMELRMLGGVPLECISRVLECFRYSCIRSIELYIETLEEDPEKLEKLIKKHPKIYGVAVFSSDKKIPIERVRFIKTDYRSVVERDWNLEQLMVSYDFYTESIKYNTFYHSKIAIDELGLCHNDLSLKENYGHIDTIDLEELAQDKHFTRYWDVSVDQIEELKDSELRRAVYPARELRVVDGKYHIVR